ncbi:hypothetical protein IKR20_03435 [bacterium]|nr:hypothetical protein [bacterium]
MEDNRFSWIYTQFVSENIFVNILIHETDMFGLNQTKYSSITYCTKNGERGYSKIQHSIYTIFSKISNNKLFINFSNEMIEISGIIEYKNNLSFQNVLHKEQNGQISHWDVIIPHGNFFGEIKYMSKIVSSKAFVYQDKQYGTLPIQSFLNRWAWSVTINDFITNGMFSILSKDNNSVTIKFSCDGTNISKEITRLFDKNWVDDLEKLSDAAYNDYRIKSVDVDNRPIRKRIKEKHDDFEITYYRYVCKSSSLICGSCEYMKIH